MKVCDALFVGTLCLLLAGPLLLFGAQEGVRAPLPSCLTSEDAVRLAGGIAKDDVEENLSLAGFQEGALQNALAGKVSNHVPLKAAALRANAAAQRQTIAAAKELFRYDVAPTSLGSGLLYLEEVDAVSYDPIPLDTGMKVGLRKFAVGLADIARERPDLDVVIYLVGGYHNPAVSPVYAIDPARDFDNIMEFCASAIGECPENLHLLGSEYDDIEGYYQDFFRTDHHWNARGAHKAYEQIADSLAMPKIEPSGETSFDQLRFAGSLSRTALCQLEEVPFDLNMDFSDLRLTSGDGKVMRVDEHARFWSSARTGTVYDFYDAYFDDLSLGTFEGGRGDRDVCLISNSYGGAIQRSLAASSRSLRTFRDLHPSFGGGATFSSRADIPGVDALVFVANPKDCSILGVNHADYFE